LLAIRFLVEDARPSTKNLLCLIKLGTTQKSNVYYSQHRPWIFKTVKSRAEFSRQNDASIKLPLLLFCRVILSPSKLDRRAEYSSN
jgi:hypothetical protein